MMSLLYEVRKRAMGHQERLYAANCYLVQWIRIVRKPVAYLLEVPCGLLSP